MPGVLPFGSTSRLSVEHLQEFTILTCKYYDFANYKDLPSISNNLLNRVGIINFWQKRGKHPL
jgi:hypothetical protein